MDNLWYGLNKPNLCPVGFPAPTDGAFLLCRPSDMKIRENGMPEESVWIAIFVVNKDLFIRSVQSAFGFCRAGPTSGAFILALMQRRACKAGSRCWHTLGRAMDCRGYSPQGSFAIRHSLSTLPRG